MSGRPHRGPSRTVTPHPPLPGRPRLSVVIPAYGEGERIATTVDVVRRELRSAAVDGGLEVVVADDGSDDDTAARAEEAGADRVVRLPVNRGKGAAVRAGVLAARGSTVVFTDADLSYPPAQITRLRDRVEEGWDVVVGSRRHPDTHALIGAGRLREVSGRVFNAVTRVVLTQRFGDTQCGLKGFHQDAAQQLFAHTRLDRFAFDVEVLWLAGHFGYSVTEVPVQVSHAEGSTVKLQVDALRMVRDIAKLRWWAWTGSYDRQGSGPDVAPCHDGPEVAPD